MGRIRNWLASCLTLAFLLFIAGGCVRTLEPVLKDEQVIVDKSLVGAWVSDDGKLWAEVTLAGNGKTYDVIYTDEKGKKGSFDARLGKIGDNLIAEFHPNGDALDASDIYKGHLVPVYSFWVIIQTAPQLKFTMMSQDWLKNYLKDHPDDLKTLKMPGEDDFIVTSPTDVFQAFLLQHIKDDGAMGKDKPAVMVRPGDPTTRSATLQ